MALPPGKPQKGTFAALYQFEQRQKQRMAVPVEPATPLHAIEEPATRHSNPRVAGIRTNQKARSKVQMNCRVNAEIAKRVKIFCAEHNLELHEFWEQAATRMFEPPATRETAHDDHDDTCFDDNACARAYRKFTGNPWKPKDARDARPFQNTDPRLIEIAMVLTIERKLRGNTSKIPVKSFNYFVDEIALLEEQKRLKTLPAAIDDYHKYVLDTWERRIRKVRDEKWKGSL